MAPKRKRPAPSAVKKGPSPRKKKVARKASQSLSQSSTTKPTKRGIINKKKKDTKPESPSNSELSLGSSSDKEDEDSEEEEEEQDEVVDQASIESLFDSDKEEEDVTPSPAKPKNKPVVPAVTNKEKLKSSSSVNVSTSSSSSSAVVQNTTVVSDKGSTIADRMKGGRTGRGKIDKFALDLEMTPAPVNTSSKKKDVLSSSSKKKKYEVLDSLTTLDLPHRKVTQSPFELNTHVEEVDLYVGLSSAKKLLTFPSMKPYAEGIVFPFVTVAVGQKVFDVSQHVDLLIQYMLFYCSRYGLGSLNVFTNSCDDVTTPGKFGVDEESVLTYEFINAIQTNDELVSRLNRISEFWKSSCKKRIVEVKSSILNIIPAVVKDNTLSSLEYVLRPVSTFITFGSL